VFPTECRTSGVGFASGAGRLGGIVSSLSGGVMLAGAGAAGFFGGVALALVLSVLCVLTLRQHIPRQLGKPEEILFIELSNPRATIRQ